jgi:hypothetical protein
VYPCFVSRYKTRLFHLVSPKWRINEKSAKYKEIFHFDTQYREKFQLFLKIRHGGPIKFYKNAKVVRKKKRKILRFGRKANKNYYVFYFEK